MVAKELAIHQTRIPGLLRVDIPVYGDSRGWFKENWQREKMVGLGLPDFSPVQNNVSYNEGLGVIRGIHAEPWDKFISIAVGKVFAAIVDLREGQNFGLVETFELAPDTALFVPKGLGNSYQTLEDRVAYTYLVNSHWSPTIKYGAVNVADPDLKISWPIPISQAEVSEKDKINPSLAEYRKNFHG